MKIMKDTTAMAYALREFFACQVGRSRLEFMDSALFAGEPYIPQEIRDDYLNGVTWNKVEREELLEYFAVIPLERAA